MCFNAGMTTSDFRFHRRYADYFYATAGEVVEGDGVRLLPDPARGRTVPVELMVPLFVESMSALGTLTTLTLVDRSSHIHHVLGDLPEGVVVTKAVVVFENDETILIRG